MKTSFTIPPIIPLPPAPLNIPPTLDLLSTVTYLHTRRQDRIKAYLHDRECEHQAEITRLFPARVARDEAWKRKRREDAHRERMDRTYEAREKRRMARVKKLRELPRSVERMSAAELWDGIERVVEMEMVGKGLARAKKAGETKEEWWERIGNLHKLVDPFAKEEWERISKTGRVKYVEGIPRNVKFPNVGTVSVNLVAMLVPMPRRVNRVCNIVPELTKLDIALIQCLQCTVKGMQCSHTVQIGKPKRPGQCSRCKRNGDRCLVRYPGHPDVFQAWLFTNNMSEGGEEWRETVWGLWQKRYRKGRKALPMWHENDKEENKRDLGYKKKEWWNVLKDPTTRW
ncbi:Fc.00g077480.m01.CDS01 [Cosmosporella sp. VM-42]